MASFTQEEFAECRFKQGMICLRDCIDEWVAKEIEQSILYLNAQDQAGEMTRSIHGNGGSVLAGLDIYDITRYSKAL